MNLNVIAFDEIAESTDKPTIEETTIQEESKAADAVVDEEVPELTEEDKWKLFEMEGDDNEEDDDILSSIENIIPPQLQKGWGSLCLWASNVVAVAADKTVELSNIDEVKIMKARASESIAPMWQKTCEAATPYWEKTVATTVPLWETTKERAALLVEETKRQSSIAAENIKPTLATVSIF